MKPIELNYKMPAEWEKHEKTFISWPVKDSMVYPEDYEKVTQGYYDIIKAISEFEHVSVLVNTNEIEIVNRLLPKDNVEILPIDHNDAWLRDNGPTFILNDKGDFAGINWEFNAWGEKYSPWDLDNKVATKILTSLGIQQFDAPFVMEGGSFHVDGEGTLITTEECLLNKNRNPHLTKQIVEQYLHQYLNVSKVIWLKQGLSGDETDGHVDNVACFVSPGKVMIQVCDDEQDENYLRTKENLAILSNETDAKGRKIEIIPIQQPPRREKDGVRLTLSYLNFYFVNGGIILPVFGGNAIGTDQLALEKLKDLFPERRVHTVDGNSIISEGGNVHCTTQQMPSR
ncbi:agmatine deiminase family protein [Aquibacillus kalidii]|uniref:agmatine deiminase family protein n=1 Tax=Aquibacillus kalidii TaxID=2762597 RepID=UPI0016492697|nr:agmatine deiminase family protein [Aquibacillus kalidii]